MSSLKYITLQFIMLSCSLYLYIFLGIYSNNTHYMCSETFWKHNGDTFYEGGVECLRQ